MDSIEKIYEEHSKTVYGYLVSMTHSADLAEELTQETFYQALKGLDRFDGSCKVTTWLCAIAQNQWMAYRRRNQPERSCICVFLEIFLFGRSGK